MLVRIVVAEAGVGGDVEGDAVELLAPAAAMAASGSRCGGAEGDVHSTSRTPWEKGDARRRTAKGLAPSPFAPRPCPSPRTTRMRRTNSGSIRVTPPCVFSHCVEDSPGTDGRRVANVALRECVSATEHRRVADSGRHGHRHAVRLPRDARDGEVALGEGVRLRDVAHVSFLPFTRRTGSMRKPP